MAVEPDPLAPLQATLRDFGRWCQADGIPGVIIGGVAAALLGRPRLTRDVDAVILLAPDRLEAFLAAGAQFGFAPRVRDALAFAREAQVLLVRHGPGGIDVDVALGGLPFEEEAIARAVSKDVGGTAVQVPTPEDLIIMKAVAHRPRDLADIEGILDAHPRLDLRRVRRWVGEFAAALDTPELLGDLEDVIRRQRGQKRKRKG